MNLAFLIIPLLGGALAFLTRYVDSNRHQNPKKHTNVASRGPNVVPLLKKEVPNNAMEQQQA